MSNLNSTVTQKTSGRSDPQHHCFHCGLPVITPGEFQTSADGRLREFCCGGCLAVFEYIHSGGLERYYALRDALGNRTEALDNEQFLVYDNPRMQEGWLTLNDGTAQAELLVEGIACAACVWLIEHRLTQLPGVEFSDINFSSHRLNVCWNPEIIKASALMLAVHQIGYRALPYTQEARQSSQQHQRHALLKRLGVAGALGMQVMVISVALYAGDWFGIEPGLEQFLRRVNLLLTVPIMGYAAQPFFLGAWRGIYTRTPGMDLPVSLGISLAFAGSLWTTVTGSGDIYYDSIAMFVFLLLGARYLELGERIKGLQVMDSLTTVVPRTANRQRDDQTFETVPTVETEPGDRILVRAGEVVPADGVIFEGHSRFDESILTGEDRPTSRNVGDTVIAGSMNLSQPVTITITTLPGTTVLDSILRLAEQSQMDKPRISQLAEQVSRWFVMAVILLAVAVATLGVWSESADWLSTTIAVLVVTCPCALSLATPLALHATSSSLLRRGIHIIRGHALETLCRTTHVIFDKTGTLTYGEMKLDPASTANTMNLEEALRIAAALEQGANHPLADAFLKAAGSGPLPVVSHFAIKPGLGVSGCVNGKYYRLGSASFVLENSSLTAMTEPAEQCLDDSGTVVMLADRSTLLATFWFQDRIRSGAAELVKQLQHEGVNVSLLSGDRPSIVGRLAKTLGIQDASGGCLPQEKLSYLNKLIEESGTVMMVGDGINDAPALSRAHLGIALARKVNLAAVHADMVVSASDLNVILDARRIAKRTSRIIQQNITWALAYNVLAVPAALAGLVPPWLAGIGMSLSSVVVVMNASRLGNQ